MIKVIATAVCLVLMACNPLIESTVDELQFQENLSTDMGEPERLNLPKSIMLVGASFASSDNGWFEYACSKLNITAVNKSVPGEAIFHVARRMYKESQYTFNELENSDVLLLMHVHNANVFIPEEWEENLNDYGDISFTKNYNISYDYVIRKYKADCAALQFNPKSRYYNHPGGKPAIIMLCTHWHDSRTVFNKSVRLLAEKWNLPLVEFDTNIGFSKDDPANADPGEPSRAVADDFETMGKVTYGWHPNRGKDKPIQQKMALIFIEKLIDTYQKNE